MSHPNSYVEVVTPSTAKYDLIWQYNHCRWDKLRCGHTGVGKLLIQCDWCPYKKEKFGHKYAHRKNIM